MKRYEALIITGKLEVQFQDNEKCLSELANLQEAIKAEDVDRAAICLGRISELTKMLSTKKRDDILSLKYLILDGLIEEEKEIERKLNMKVDELQLGIRSKNALRAAGRNTVRDLVEMTMDDFERTRNLGTRNQEEVIRVLNELGFSVKEAK